MLKIITDTNWAQQRKALAINDEHEVYITLCSKDEFESNIMTAIFVIMTFM